MWIIISAVIITLVFLCGLTDILQSIWLYIIRPKGDEGRVMVIFLKPEIAIQQLRSGIEKLRWSSDGFSLIAAIDCGLDSDTYECCQRIAHEESNVLMGRGEVLGFIKSYGCEDT